MLGLQETGLCNKPLQIGYLSSDTMDTILAHPVGERSPSSNPENPGSFLDLGPSSNPENPGSFLDLGPSSNPEHPGSFPDLGPSSHPFNPGSI